MKFSTFLSVLTVLFLLFASPQLFGQCHGGGGSHSSKSIKESDATTNQSEVIFYACTMHPEVTSLKPGTCSKCGMSMDQKKADLYKSEQQKDSIYYTCSMHPEVKENKPGKCPKCGMVLIEKSVNKKLSKENMNKISFKVYGNCGMCKARIEKAAKSVNGVLSAEWDAETNTIEVVTENNKLSSKEVSEAIAAVGHDTEYNVSKKEVYNKLPDCCQYERKKK